MASKEVFVLLERDYDVVCVLGCFSTLKKCFLFIEKSYEFIPELHPNFKNEETIYIRPKGGGHSNFNITIEKRILS